MKNNKGFSLIELIVVIAIMAVLTGLITLSITAVWGTYAKECAKEMESYLNKARVTTMGKMNEGVHFYKDASSGAYYAEFVEYDSTTGNVNSSSELKKIGRKSLTVKYAMDGGASTELNGDLYIYFDRSSGAFANHPVNGNACSDIWVEQGSHTWHLILYKDTGKVEVLQ